MQLADAASGLKQPFSSEHQHCNVQDVHAIHQLASVLLTVVLLVTGIQLLCVLVVAALNHGRTTRLSFKPVLRQVFHMHCASLYPLSQT